MGQKWQCCCLSPMPIAPKIKAFVEKLQALPEDKKKIILWATMAVVGLILGVIFFGIISNRLKSINQASALEPFNSLIEQAKLSDESIDKINEVKDNFSNVSNSAELLKQLEDEANKEQTK